MTTFHALGRMHGAPYRRYGYVPLRFGGTSLGELEHNKDFSRDVVPETNPHMSHNKSMVFTVKLMEGRILVKRMCGFEMVNWYLDLMSCHL